MRRLAGLLGALAGILALGAAPAWAATYYVSPTGDSTYSGVDCNNAKTLQWANLNIRAGDVCYLCDGAYPDKIQPGNTGTSGSRISFIGDIGTPGNVSVSQVQVDSTSAPLGGLPCGGFVTVKGVRSRSNIDLRAMGPYDHTDSVLYCTTDNGLDLAGRGNVTIRYCTFGDGLNANDHSVIGYNTAGTGTGGTRTEKAYYVTGLNILDCTFYANTSPGGLGGNAMTFQNIRNSTFSRNRVHGTVVPTSSGKSIMTWYQTQSMTVSDNYFGGISHSGSEPNGESYLVSFRDAQRFNTFERDTFFEETSNGTPSNTPLKVGIEVGGMYETGTIVDPGDRNVAWHNCFVRVRGLVEMEKPYPAYTFRNNVFVTQSNMRIGNTSAGFTDSLEFRHNTVATLGSGSNFWGHKFTNSTIAQNIFYSQSMDLCNSAGVSYYTNTPGFTDSNLVWSVDPADSMKAIDYGHVSGCEKKSLSQWAALTGGEAASHWGSPQFTDSVFWTFNPKVVETGLAISSDLWADGYVGAMPAEADQTDPTLSVNWPASSRPLPLGGKVIIGWTCSDGTGVAEVKVYVADEAGGPWTTVATKDGTSPGTYTYRVPLSPTTDRLYMRVTAFDAAGNSTVSTQNFTIALDERFPNPFLIPVD